MLAGIRKKLMCTYLLIIFITVTFFEFASIVSIHHYYLNSVSNTLKNKAELVGSFYNNFLDYGDIYNNSQQIIDLFAERTFQLQITDKNGNIIADSLGIAEEKTVASDEIIRTALSGKKGEFKGRQINTGERIYACTVPLTSNGMIVGAMCFTTSLDQTYQEIINLVLRILIFGLILLGVVSFFSFFFSSKISMAIEEVREMNNQDR